MAQTFLQKMLPSPAKDYLTDCRGGRIQLRGYCALTSALRYCFANIQDLFTGEPCLSVSFAGTASTFAFHVLQIIFMRAEEQMQRIYANAVVAFMTNQCTRLTLIIQIIRHAMRTDLFAVHEKPTIGIACAALPFPASGWLNFNFRPKFSDLLRGKCFKGIVNRRHNFLLNRKLCSGLRKHVQCFLNPFFILLQTSFSGVTLRAGSTEVQS